MNFQDSDLSGLTIEELRTQLNFQRKANRWQQDLLVQARVSNKNMISKIMDLDRKNYDLEVELEKLRKQLEA